MKTKDDKIKELEILLDKVIMERDYYYKLFIKVNALLVRK